MQLLSRSVGVNNASENCTVENIVQLPTTTEKDCPLLFYLFPQAMPIIYFILCCFGLLANIFEVTVFLKNITSWKSSGVVIINLVLADMITLFSFVPYAVYLNLNYSWTMGKLMCQITLFSMVLGTTANTTFICAISLERFFAIVFPIRFCHLCTVKNACIFSVFLWIIASVTPLAVLSNVQYKTHRGKDYYCGMLYNLESGLSLFIFSSLVFILFNVLVPLIIIVVSYIQICKTLQQFYKRKRAPGNKEKTMKLISSVIAVYLICWFPAQVMNTLTSSIYQMFRTCKNVCILTQVTNSCNELVNFLSILNACIDPVMYRLNHGFPCCLKLKNRAVSCGCCPRASHHQQPPPLN
ncbi:type-1 angiotensin II receptor B-like [Acipenser ruthenus]|uniref:type-1 angiotensin II receptor B-like n=1 Tax=Acipenser ruthenus TaxID=7906 RepID=UPI0027414CA4|nr:type-1 angiotensin II receptor B-like [Acipenser ruthenus]